MKKKKRTKEKKEKEMDNIIYLFTYFIPEPKLQTTVQLDPIL